MMDRVDKSKFELSDYNFKSQRMITNAQIVSSIVIWSSEIELDAIYQAEPYGNNEYAVTYAFKSEEDQSMFTLRWHDILLQSYQNSVTRQIIDIYSQIEEKYLPKREPDQ